jgi:hypothetical protein
MKESLKQKLLKTGRKIQRSLFRPTMNIGGTGKIKKIMTNNFIRKKSLSNYIKPKE